MFRLHSGVTEGAKDYLKLFDIIDSSDDEKEVKTIFLKARRGASFGIICNYLYQNIIKSLTISTAHSIEDRLLEGLQETKVLYEKGLIKDSLNLIQEYKQIAKENEKFLLFGLFARLELDYNSQQQFKFLNEKEILNAQSDLKRSLYQELNVMEHSSLYEILYLRYLQKGAVKNEPEKMQLNDLLISEMMLAENPRYRSLQGRKIHSLFQSIYFMMISDNSSSLRSFMELNELFEQHPGLWGDPPFHYIYHLQGVLSSLRNAGRYPEMKQFIDKLKKVKTSSRSSQMMIFQSLFIFEIQYLIDTHHYKEALKLVQEHEDKLSDAASFLISDLAILSFFSSLVYYLNSEYKKASQAIKIVYTEKSLISLPVFRMMKLLNLFILYQRKDWSLLDYELKSYKKILKPNEKIIETEKILLRFFKDLYGITAKNKINDLLEKTEHALFLVSSSAFEKPLLNYTDFRLLLKNLTAI